MDIGYSNELLGDVQVETTFAARGLYQKEIKNLNKNYKVIVKPDEPRHAVAATGPSPEEP